MTTLRQALPALVPNATNDLGDLFLTNATYNADVDGAALRADTLAAVAGAVVLISGKRAVTGADGPFAIEDLPGGLGGPGVHAGVVRATGFDDKPLFFDVRLSATVPPYHLVNHLGSILIAPQVGGIPGGPTTIRGKVRLEGQPMQER